ncbi:MAG: nucleoside deaminase [Polaromonas sp.]
MQHPPARQDNTDNAVDLAPDELAAMRLAIAASREALDAGNQPYGATLVSADGKILQVAGNTQVTSGDGTAHAEIVAVREASARLGAAAVRGSTVYASGEPCAMCSGALFWAGVQRVVYGATNPQMAALFGGESLPIRCADVVAGASPAMRVDGPLLGDEAMVVLRDAAARRSA